ncbi:AAA family ATPase [Pasteurella atlantica]|uniref:ATP-binding protein n=1 Tax=Pasteurellaceae TaxID=712 RepID=UPI0027601331|nr:AAA family ATPase [Pasteurella atlantica]MDP8034108.1 AAA family ATPase [Pasteurella atlantica]MDP8035986.1 AAA family ATPase [Pasteurella atlantica]MDP8037936.1 AAA family ATPase [Pasteurella atlantica]MDP8048346.1 AAA family ATPase [Pasteurella atlantica]MDP8050248.1 AAA family ATPase [Pasteurella atlantica]
MLKRKAYDKLIEWKQQSLGKTALLINGARRVGKSYLCKVFAQNEYKSHLIIDFANVPKEIKNLFEEESYDLDLFFLKLSAFYGVILYERETLFIFDEIQQYPRARQLIKYLVQDGRYDYIETGSLLSIKRNVQDIVIPSEEEHIFLYPLDFEEFLWAMGDKTTIPMLKTFFHKKQPLGQALHRKTLNYFRQYMLIGGMPQVVDNYIKNKDFIAADKIKRNILTLYRNDIAKFARNYQNKVLAIFDEIPGQLSKKEKKYTLSALSKNARLREYEDAFMWLSDAMIVNTCFNTTDPNVGLALSSDFSTRKCYMADTGLLLTLAFYDNEQLHSEVYKNILFDKLNINEGMLMENIVAQILRTQGYRLFFYSRRDKENTKNNMEIDFLLSHNKKISAVEVKSSSYRKHSSLDKFNLKFNHKIEQSIILYQKDLMIKDNVLHLPIYMAMFL